MGFVHEMRRLQDARLSGSDDVSGALGSLSNHLVFPSKKRLPRAAFPHILGRGRRVSSPHFVAILSKESSGYAVIVPKKVARLSVTRHRIKRRTLEALRTIPLPFPTLILFPKQSVAYLTHGDVVAELSELLSKIPQ